MSRGIDYSGPRGTCNRDPETGIRYGIIPMHRLGEFAYESFEAEYDATCPECGDELSDDDTTEASHYSTDLEREIWGLKCPRCEHVFASEHAYSDEASRHVLNDGEYEGFQGRDDGDVWITKSPYFTRAAFCSPCAPGACYLTSPCDDGERAYCLGIDWFETGECPYPVYSVATGELVQGVLS